MVLSKLDVEQKLKEIKPFLVKEYSISKIGYFGSFAKGNQTTNSDIDIIVDFSDVIGWRFINLKDFLESVFERKVDLITERSIRKKWKSQVLNQVNYV